MSAPMPHAKIWLVTIIVATVMITDRFTRSSSASRRTTPGRSRRSLPGIWQLTGNGDALANILLYIPLGFFFVLGFRRGPAQNVGLVLATATGALLSLSMELTRSYDGGRVTSFSDFYTKMPAPCWVRWPRRRSVPASGCP